MYSRKTPLQALRCVSAALLLCLTLGAQAQQNLTPFSATFKVKMKGARGEMHMSLTKSDDGFQAISRIKPKGLARLFARGSIEEASTFVLRDDSLTPLSFQSSDSVSRHKKSSTMTFDWAADRARGSDNDGEFDHPITASTYDRVSIQYALMLDLINDTSGRDYIMLDGQRLKELEVQIVGEDTVKVPYGEFEVIGIQHRRKNSSRATTLWCAKKLGYLPVKIEQHRKGKRILLAEMLAYSD